MSVKVRIPTAFRRLTGDKDCLELEAISISEAMEKIGESYPDFKNRIFEENGKLKKFVLIYMNGEDIRFTEGLETKVPDDGEITILPSYAGG